MDNQANQHTPLSEAERHEIECFRLDGLGCCMEFDVWFGGLSEREQLAQIRAAHAEYDAIYPLG